MSNKHGSSTELPNFPIVVPPVELERLELPSDKYAIHVLPIMLEQIRAGKNVPTIAIRKASNFFGSLIVVRGLMLPTISLTSGWMLPHFADPLPGSTTVVWLEVQGPLWVWHDKGKVPNWIEIDKREKAHVLADLMAEVNRKAN